MYFSNDCYSLSFTDLGFQRLWLKHCFGQIYIYNNKSLTSSNALSIVWDLKTNFGTRIMLHKIDFCSVINYTSDVNEGCYGLYLYLSVICPLVYSILLFLLLKQQSELSARYWHQASLMHVILCNAYYDIPFTKFLFINYLQTRQYFDMCYRNKATKWSKLSYLP